MLPLNGVWIRLTVLIGAALLALLTFSASAQVEDLEVNLSGFSAENESAAEVVFTVVDSDAKPVVDLTAEDFAVSLDGQPVTVASLERGVDSAQPISVLLALDVSGSMEGGALDEAKASAISFLDTLEPQDSVAVMTFANSVELVLPFTINRELAKSAINGLAASGETTLYQATEDSLRLVAGEGASYRAVILLSDGVDNGSALSQEAALATAGTLGVPVFAIGLGQDIDRQYLEALATESGGTFAETPSPEGLAQLYQEAGELLRGQYILSLDTSAVDFIVSAPATLRLDVALGDRIGRAERVVCGQDLCVGLSELAERLESATSVTATVIASEPVTSVSFEIDGEVVGTGAEEPYTLTIDPETLEEGERTLSVTVETESGQTLSSQALISIGAAASGGSMGTVFIAGGALALLVVVAALYLLYRRRKQGGPLRRLDPDNLRPPSKDVAPMPDGPKDRLRPDGVAPRAAAVEVKGHLYVTGGAMNDEAFPVGGSPITVGSGNRCQIRLTHEVANEEQVPSEYMRVWVRDRRLMVHEVRRMTVMGAVGGRWAKLESGDTLPLGPYTIRFELGEKGALASTTRNGQTDVADAPDAPSSAPPANGTASFDADPAPDPSSPPNGHQPSPEAPSPAQDAEEFHDPSLSSVLRDQPAQDDEPEQSSTPPADGNEPEPATDSPPVQGPRFGESLSPAASPSEEGAEEQDASVPNVLRDRPDVDGEPSRPAAQPAPPGAGPSSPEPESGE